MTEYVDKKYLYQNEYEMLKQNIAPVCMETITPDGITRPPNPSRKRASGRPKKKRIRKRPNNACDPEKSIIVCSCCHKRGHNVRTCLAREEHSKQADGNKKLPARQQMNDLDLS